MVITMMSFNQIWMKSTIYVLDMQVKDYVKKNSM